MTDRTVEARVRQLVQETLRADGGADPLASGTLDWKNFSRKVSVLCMKLPRTSASSSL